MPFIQTSKKRRSSLPITCRMIKPSTKSKNIDDVGVKRKASQDLIDYVTKIKRSRSEKKPSLVPVESEKPQKCEEIEVVAPPKPIVISSEKVVQVCTPKKAVGDAAVNSSLQDLILKAKLSKFGGDRGTTVDESEKLNKEHLRKEKIEKEREAFRIALNKMKPTTELFEDNLSIMKEFEESYGLRYFDSQSHEQFVHSTLYDCTIIISQEHSSSMNYSNSPTKLKNIDSSVERKASKKFTGDEAAKTKRSRIYSNPPTNRKNIDGSVKRKASQKLKCDEAAKIKRSSWSYSNPLTELKNIGGNVKRKGFQKFTGDKATKKIYNSLSYSNPPTKLKNIDGSVKTQSSQKLMVDEAAKTKRNRSKLTLKKRTHWIPVVSKETNASEKRKLKEKERAAVAVPVSTTIYVEKYKKVFTLKKAAQITAVNCRSDLILKEKLSKLGVDKTITVVEADKLKKESLQKERDKEREAFRIALDKMKPKTELFEDNLSTTKELEELCGLQYFDRKFHEQFVHDRLYLLI